MTQLFLIFTNLLDRLLSRAWNLAVRLLRRKPKTKGAVIGHLVVDGRVGQEKVLLSDLERMRHIVITGKTGFGKSYFLRQLLAQDIQANHGFVVLDLHGDLTPFILQAVAEAEKKSGRDLSEKLIIVDPADQESSVGFNLLQASDQQNVYQLISAFTITLEKRWEKFGPRTFEVLTNGLFLLIVNGCTILEFGHLLTNATFRARCLRHCDNAEVKAYFENRYNHLSDAMKSATAGPVLNKLSSFTVDPKFRHLLGVTQSTFSISEALEKQRWIVLNFPKGKLGEQALTFLSLFLAYFEHTVFARRSRSLFTLYADEVQNLLATDASLEVLLAECRKLGLSVVTANQYLNQLPVGVRAATEAVGTRVFFQLSATDAETVAHSFHAGHSTAHALKTLPVRRCSLVSGSRDFVEIEIPPFTPLATDSSDLYRRCQQRWTRRRAEIEAEILKRQPTIKTSAEEMIDAWE